MVERYKGALARSPVRVYAAQCGLVDRSRELRPVSVHDLRKRLEQRVGDVAQERWTRIETCQHGALKFKALPKKVIVLKVDNITLGHVHDVERGKVGEDLLRGETRGLVNNRLGVGVHLGEIHGLQQLRRCAW